MAAIETRSASSLKSKTTRVSHGYHESTSVRGKTVRKRSRARTIISAFPFFPKLMNKSFSPYKSH